MAKNAKNTNSFDEQNTEDAAGKGLGNVAYTPMSEKEKAAAMQQLIKDLHSGKKGGYRSPGGPYTNVSDRH
tara:strand:+ start:938 stop:1150 length:213 start_codon:yes stop_codon:yes gene_type:complete